MGKTTAQEQQFLVSCLAGLAKRPARYAFDAKESADNPPSLPAASRPFALGPAKPTNDLDEAATFGITVKLLKGAAAPVAIAGLTPFTAVDALKAKVAALFKQDVDTVRLVFKGRAVSGAGKTLDDFGIKQGVIVHLMITAAAASTKSVTEKVNFADVAARVGCSKQFWSQIEDVVKGYFDGNKESEDKVMNAFISSFSGLLTDKDAAANVKKHARK